MSNYKGKGKSKPTYKGAKSNRGRNSSSSKVSKERDAVTKFEKELNPATGNDIAWYNKNPQLLEDAARINFSTIPGLFNKIGQYMGGTITDGTDAVKPTATEYHEAYHEVPGIMVLSYMPTIGRTEGHNQAANLAALHIYTRVRKANSGAANYQAPDIMMYVLAMTSAMEYISALKRLYGIATTYNPQNRYYPRAALQALGVSNPEYMFQNMARFRTMVNSLVLSINQLSVPATMPIVQRRIWMNSNVFLDEPNPKAQSYAFLPSVFMKFDPTTEVGSNLVPTSAPWNAEYASSEDWINAWYEYGMGLLRPLVYNSDIQIMCGDIEKAYGEGGMLKAAVLNEDYNYAPVYDGTVSAQIENATICKVDMSEDLASYTITQDPITSAIIQSPRIRQSQYLTYMNKTVLNSHDINPSAAEVTEITSLHAVPFKYVGDSLLVSIWEPTCGTEIIHDAQIWYMSREGEPVNRFDIDSSFRTINAESTNYKGSMAWELARMMSVHSVFHRAPFLYYFRTTTSGDREMYVHGNLVNYTYVDPETFDRIHRVKTMSLFDVMT